MKLQKSSIRFCRRQIERLLAAPIGKLSDHISEEKVREAGKSLTETIITAAKEKLPEAIREFNIGSVVREKINNYPVGKTGNVRSFRCQRTSAKNRTFRRVIRSFDRNRSSIQFYFFARK